MNTHIANNNIVSVKTLFTVKFLLKLWFCLSMVHL